VGLLRDDGRMNEMARNLPLSTQSEEEFAKSFSVLWRSARALLFPGRTLHDLSLGNYKTFMCLRCASSGTKLECDDIIRVSLAVYSSIGRVRCYSVGYMLRAYYKAVKHDTLESLGVAPLLPLSALQVAARDVAKRRRSRRRRGACVLRARARSVD
jgi:hypothetical protein